MTISLCNLSDAMNESLVDQSSKFGFDLARTAQYGQASSLISLCCSPYCSLAKPNSLDLSSSDSNSINLIHQLIKRNIRIRTTKERENPKKYNNKLVALCHKILDSNIKS